VSLLDIDLALRRASAPVWIACALGAAALAIYAFATVPLNARIEERTREHARVQQAAAESGITRPPEKTLIEERLDAFVATLGEKRMLTAYVSTVFEQAGKHDLALAQAVYKLEFDKIGEYHTYQMTLPVRGAYPRLRGFVDATLAQIPSAALEDVDFTRDGIGATQAEAKLRFVFFLKDAPS
jgi:hypothetical protein